MKGVLIGLIGVLVFPLSVAFAQPSELITAVEIYHDYDADALWGVDDDPIAGWTLQIFDDTWTLLDDEISDDNGQALLTSPGVPRYACALPVVDWIMTQPLGGPSHPNDVAWYCYDFQQRVEEATQFGVLLENPEPETGGEVIDEDNSPPTEKLVEEGDVLGETSDPEVLAETGSVGALAPLLGSLTGISALWLARRPKID